MKMQKNKIYCVFCGFSLIEMLLVIAVIGVISTLAINFSQQQKQELKVKKASLQIQQIFIAAKVYRSKNGIWPKLSDQDDFEKNYLPQNIAQGNPWGMKYIYAAKPSEDMPYRFQVSTMTNDKNTALQISHKLPNAIIDNVDNRVVKAEIARPIKYADNGLVHVGNITINPYRLLWYPGIIFNAQGYAAISIPSVTCPGTQKAQIMLLPTFFGMSLLGHAHSLFPGQQFMLTTSTPEIDTIGATSIQCDEKNCNFGYNYTANMCNYWFDVPAYYRICDPPQPFPLSGYATHTGGAVTWTLNDFIDPSTFKPGQSSDVYVKLNYMVFCQ